MQEWTQVFCKCRNGHRYFANARMDTSILQRHEWTQVFAKAGMDTSILQMQEWTQVFCKGRNGHKYFAKAGSLYSKLNDRIYYFAKTENN